MPGMVAPLINRYPNGTAVISKEDDELWGLLAEMDIPLTIHVQIVDFTPEGAQRPHHRRNPQSRR